MELRSIEQFNPENYACYALTEIKENFILSTVHPNGLKDYPHYHTYDIGSHTLIAFTKINFYKTDFVYRITSENHTEEINSENYEFLEDVLNNSYDKEKYTFIIMRSAANYDEAVNGKTEPVDSSRRCDLETYAALDFYDTNKENAPDLADRNYLGNDNVLGWTVFLSSMSNIYIVKLSHNQMIDRAYKDWPARSNMAQTFPHIIKMAYQWSLLNQDPWISDDLIAEKCKLAFEDWNIPDDAIEEIANSEEDTVLSLFLSGDENPRKSIVENSEVSPKFKKWFMSKLRYRTLSSISVNYPKENTIPKIMLDKEKEFFEKSMYKFCIENNLDPETSTALDILDKAYYSDSSYKEVNNSITDIVKKNINLEEKNLVKQYVENTRKIMGTNTDNQ